jgi:putative DNA primase/helicase
MLGNAPEQAFFILYGSGANGKTTFYETIKEALGTYAIEAASDTFLLKRSDPGIPHDLARIAGKRLILAAETDKGRRLSEAMIKQYTGGKTVVARQLFKEFFEFEATGKIWLITNHKPNIYDHTHAMWRRVMLVPFLYQIPNSLQDKHFGEKLRKTELEGIFNWIVEGYKIWKTEGINPPAEVLAATRDYRDEMDYLGGFIAEECVQDELATTTVAELYNAYKTWCDQNGEKTISSTKFGFMLTERGFTKSRETTGKKRVLYKGIRLDRDELSNPVHVSQ